MVQFRMGTKSFKMNIGIMVTGFTRGHYETFNKFIRNIFNDAGKTVFFFQIWSQNEYPKYEYYKDFYDENQWLEKEKLLVLNKQENDVILNLDIPNIYKEYKMFDSNISLFFDNDKKEDFEDLKIYVDIVNNHAQSFAMNKTFCSIKEYETKNNISFDVIVKTRYDILMSLSNENKNKIRHNIEKLYKENTPSYIPCGITEKENPWTKSGKINGKFGFMNDVFGFSNRNGAELLYGNMFENDVKIYKEHGKILSKEIRLHDLCKRTKVKIIYDFYENHINHIIVRKDDITIQSEEDIDKIINFGVSSKNNFYLTESVEKEINMHNYIRK